MKKYNDWLDDFWHSTLHGLWKYGERWQNSEDWMVDDEDNSVQIATQSTIEIKFPELCDYYKKPTVVIYAK